MKHRLLTILPAVLLAAGFSLEGAVLAEKNKSFPQIILPGAKPVQQQKIAEGELKEFIGKIIGDKAPAAKGGFRITLTDLSIPGQQIPADIVKKLNSTKKQDAFYLRGTKNSLLIVGKTPRSLVYGACFFLNKYAGVTWVYPGTQGEAYLKRDKIVIPDKIEDYQEPFTDFRIAAYTGHDRKSVPWNVYDVVKWQYRNLCLPLPRNQQVKDYKSIRHQELNAGGHMTFCHAVPNTLFAQHPEYFPLINGKRTKCSCHRKIVENGKQLPWVQRCVSNPEVKKRVTDLIIKSIKADPAGTFGICAADVKNVWCTCPECKKFGTLNGKYSTSNLYHRFFRDVTSDVLKQIPNARIFIYIYLDYRELPTDPDFRYDPRVTAIYYAHGRCVAHPINDPKCEINPPYYKLYKNWSKVFSRVGLCDYYSNANTPYCPHEYNLAADAPERIRRNDWGERAHITAQRYFENWMFHLFEAKTWWNPRTNIDDFVNETFDRYYGKSAPAMKKFQLMKRDLWKNAPGHAWYPGPNRGAYCLAVPENQKKMEGCLAEAVKLAGNDKLLLARIHMEKQAFMENWVKSAKEARDNIAAKRTISAVPVSGKIKIDGILDEPEWQKAEAVTHFVSPYTKNAMRENTNLRVLYDDRNFYVSLECMNDKAWTALKAKPHKHDDVTVGDDDSVEVFLCHPTNGLYYQFIINSLGNFYDARMMDKSFETGSTVAAKILKDRYIVEMQIPVTKLGADKISHDKQWKLHVWRNIRNLQAPETVDRGGIDGHRTHSPQVYRPVMTGGKETIPNGNFGKIDKQGKPESWRVNSPERCKIVSRNGKNIVQLKGTKIYNLLNLSDTGIWKLGSDYPCRILVSIVASGSGNLELIPSTGLPKSKVKPFHRRRKVMLSPLTKEPKDHHFEFDLEAGEGAYIFIGGRDAELYSVSAIKIAK